MSTPLAPALVADALDLAKFAVTTLKTFLDGVLGKATADVPKITGDAVTATVDAIEQHVPKSAQGFVSIALGLAQPALGTVEASANVAIVAALHQASVSVNAAVDKLAAPLA